MTIPKHIREGVEAQVTAHLRAYFDEAEEHEDDGIIDTVQERTKDFYLYRQQVDDTKTGIKTYVVAHGGVMFETPQDICQYRVTWRKLLELLNDIEPATYDDLYPALEFKDKKEWQDAVWKWWPDSVTNPRADEYIYKGEVVAEWTFRTGIVYRPVRELTDEQLVNMFDNINGDGQPYRMVWCVEEARKVLG